MWVNDLPKVATQWNSGATRDSNRGRQVLIPSALTTTPPSHTEKKWRTTALCNRPAIRTCADYAGVSTIPSVCCTVVIVIELSFHSAISSFRSHNALLHAPEAEMLADVEQRHLAAAAALQLRGHRIIAIQSSVVYFVVAVSFIPLYIIHWIIRYRSGACRYRRYVQLLKLGADAAREACDRYLLP